MYVVTNRIRTKKGFAERMAPMFAKEGPLQSMEGFVKVEVAVRTELEDYDELNVNMYWEELEHFHAWKNSDAFREAHKGGNPGQEGESPLIGSELAISKVAASISALT